MQRYRVTEIAPPKIAGRRVRPGEVVEFDPELVRYEADHGQIEPADDVVEVGPSEAAAEPTE